ncbi:hypothetical protein [Parasitella parasitica]|uniref:Uncharacterized protein n=1 Tax=Parasitella parasitica TaxID=35722 RepID=A0A0B7NAK5_9FUNG|nr:hypothetical protein [Parasitella parasitica]
MVVNQEAAVDGRMERTLLEVPRLAKSKVWSSKRPERQAPDLVTKANNVRTGQHSTSPMAPLTRSSGRRYLWELE